MPKPKKGTKTIDVGPWDGDYVGDIVNGKAHGKGKLSWQNNLNVYEGDFKNDKMTGKGKITYYNIHGGIRWIYEGGFVNGEEHGKGKQINSIGQVEKKGNWVRGCFKEKKPKKIKEQKEEKKFKSIEEEEAYWKARELQDRVCP